MGLDLAFSESQQMLRKTAQDFMQRDASKEVVQRLQETDTGCTDELWRKAADMGWLGIVIPEEYGGSGLDLASAGVLYEVLGQGPLPGPYFSSAILGSQIVLEAASDEQKRSILPAVAGGEQVLALALTEPGYSWEPGGVATTATGGNGDYVLDGLKLFVLDAMAATHLIVAAITGSAADPAGGISLFLVDRKASGVSVRRLPGFLLGRTFEVKLNSVKVPRSALLGELNQGWPALQKAIARAIPVLCAYKAGGAQALAESALEYSRIRVQFGMPIGRFQRVQDMIIEMVTQADSARWVTYETLWKLDVGRAEPEDIHVAKAVASEAYFQTCTLAHQVFSGISYSKEHPASFHTRASRTLYGFLGDPAYHRQKIARLVTAGG
ncbi:MAG: acyl-CoA dehydrogenase family protein [Dehalococcoidales bacterium]